MSDFEVHGLRISLHNAPPVYAPGGPVAALNEPVPDLAADTLEAVETAAIERGAVLTIVPCQVEQSVLAGTLSTIGYRPASAWFRGPTQPLDVSNALVRRAVTSDVPALLTIGEEARRQKQGYSARFWKMAPAEKETFAPYVTSQVESDRNVALVYEEAGEVQGYCIAQNDYVDDFAVASPAQWATIGRALLRAASGRANARGVSSFILVAPDGDADKTQMIVEEGFALFRRWYVKSLPEAA